MSEIREMVLMVKYAQRAAAADMVLTAATDPVSKTQAPRWEYSLEGGGKREPS
jgi:hypothetical protein